MGEQYYNVHCLRCGKQTGADQMGFNFDRILQESLKRDVDKLKEEPGLRIFQDVRLGLYLTHLDLMNVYGVTDSMSDVSIYIEDIIKHFSIRWGVNLTENYSADPKAAIYASEEFRNLCRKMKALQGNKKLLDLDMSERLQEVFCYLLEHRHDNNPIMHVRVLVRLAENDKGEKYASGMTVEYDTGYKMFERHMVCTCCGHPYHVRAGFCEEYIIGMLGSARVGKTAYLAALVNELKPKMGKGCIQQLQVLTDDDDGFRQFEDVILSSYRKGAKIEKTPVASDLVPMFSMLMKIKEKYALFSFIDMPGEALSVQEGAYQDVSFVLQEKPILESTKVFWFCISPEQIDHRLVSKSAESLDAIDKVIRDIKPVLESLSQTKEAKSTVALLITKSDLIETQYGLFDPKGKQGIPWDNFSGEFLWEKFITNSSKVREYLRDSNVTEIEADIVEMFGNVNGFAVAAYGQVVQEKHPNDMTGNKPSGILEPFLWTLAVLKLVRPVRVEEIPNAWWKVWKRNEMKQTRANVPERELYWK